MRQLLLITMCMLLIAASTSQAAIAGRHLRKAAHAVTPASAKLRNAYGGVTWPSAVESEREYWEGRGLSAPAGR
jgi:hypothetical protein